MQLGIFAKTFVRPTLEETLDAVVDHGLSVIQFNMACAVLPSMPDAIDPALCDRIAWATDARGLTMAAVSGTFNMIHPDPEQRQDGLRRLRVLASACKRIGTSVITLCTGTRHPDDMWKRHPQNVTNSAWRDLLASMTHALEIADANDVTLAIEPEVSNVIDSACKARRLLDHFRSPRLKVIMDAANLFQAGQLPRMGEILEEAFALIGPDIVIAHAKDLTRDGEAGDVAAGRGRLDYDHYLKLLSTHGFDGPIILHGLDESQVEGSLAFLREKLARLNP